MTASAPAHCCVCDHDVERWLPHPHQSQRSPLMVTLQTVGSDLTLHLCPRCGCNDRDRHLWLYLTAAGLTTQLAGAAILHMAPERMIEPLIKACGPARYVLGDLYPTRPHHQKVDAEALPFPDHSFDLIIANHLLEHVSQPRKALSEFHRCLKPGGVLVAQTPYAPRVKNTFELNLPATPEVAKLLFGQEDHVRLFGADIVDLFHGAGFSGELLPHEGVLPQHDARRFGCNPLEPFFGFCKPLEMADAAPA